MDTLKLKAKELLESAGFPVTHQHEKRVSKVSRFILKYNHGEIVTGSYASYPPKRERFFYYEKVGQCYKTKKFIWIAVRAENLSPIDKEELRKQLEISKDPLKTFADNLFVLRRAKGLTYDELAQLCNRNSSTIAALENGQEPRLTLAVAVAKALDVDLTEMITTSMRERYKK